MYLGLRLRQNPQLSGLPNILQVNISMYIHVFTHIQSWAIPLDFGHLDFNGIKKFPVLRTNKCSGMLCLNPTFFSRFS